MIELSTKKLESLLEEVEKECGKTEKDYNKLKKQLENCERELNAKRGLKFSIERILEIKLEN